MRKVRVLFFAADPRLGRPGGVPLELLEEMREIERHVRQARYGHRIQFKPHGAARADDLMDFLENTDARVVHFSGHGGHRGLGFVARDGYDVHPVDAAALRRVFREYHGPVRLVVLSACSSNEEAQAIADVVGCAIGTSSEISDRAAITFNSRFYRAIANGYSVQRAFESARTALQVHGVPQDEHPEIFRGNGVDPADLVLVKTYRPVPLRVLAAGVACAVTATAVAWEPPVPLEQTPSDVACGSESGAAGIRPLMDSQGAASTTPAAPAGPAAALATAKAFYRDRNYEAAASAFEEAATAGNGEAMGCLGYMYLVGRGMDPQPATGIGWLRKAAREERDAHGMYALAMAYLSGEGAVQSDFLARDWLLKAVEEKGYAEAMRSLGDLSRDERNTSSYQQALVWYQRAVDAGSVDARVDLGLMYESGWGVPRDPAAALRWYQSAAAAGSPRGMWAVGHSYQSGVAVPKDYGQAMAWYRRAAGAGSADAMNSIGVLYDNGFGVRKSQAKAKRWYKRAAKAGSQLARGNLGEFERD